MMNREKLTHILRAVASVSNARSFVVVGSATVLLTSKNIPAAMLMTNEIDVYSPDSPDEELFSDLIEGSLGPGSQFAKTFKYYADGVTSKTATMPSDWPSRARTVDIATLEGILVLVPDINDIALAKTVAWREKDQEWLCAGVRSLILDPAKMQSRLAKLSPRDLPWPEIERRKKTIFAYKSA